MTSYGFEGAEDAASPSLPGATLADFGLEPKDRVVSTTFYVEGYRDDNVVSQSVAFAPVITAAPATWDVYRETRGFG